MRKSLNILAILLLFICSQIAIQAQTTTGSLSVVVNDPSGAVVLGASITVRNNATGAERTATTSDNGTASVTDLQPGTYSVSVESSGFKRTLAPDVAVGVSQTAQVTIALEIGLADQTVTVTAAQEVINTSSPTLTNVIDTRQVRDLPLATRNPLDLAALQAGIAVVGNATRTASIAGLRGSATNVTQDGINAMDNFVKTDALFAISAPSLNSTSEFSITTGTVGSESGRGVAQINVVTKGGTNQFHGGIFYMHRNDAFNANTFFNNLAGTERQKVRQHFFGFDIGGPIYFPAFGEGGPMIWDGRDKAHFFFAYEGFRENFSATRNRTVLTPEARQGIFRYTGTNGQLQTVNLLQIGNVNTLNPITTALIGQTPAPNNTLVGDGFNTQGFRYNVTGTNPSDKYVARYDHQLVKDTPLGSHKFEFVFNYFETLLSPDTFNNLEAPFPGGVNTAQSSERWLVTGALVSNFGNATNVFRYGRQWAPVGFIIDQNTSSPFFIFSGLTNLYAGNPTTTPFLSQGRNTIVNQIKDDFTMPKGNHLLRFGVDFQDVFADTFNDTGINQVINLGTNTANGSGILLSELPFGTNAQLTAATNVYSNIVGNLASSTRTFNVTSPDSGFVTGATRARLFKQRDIAIYGQDQWRAKSNLTLNFGLRWDFMGVPTIPNGLAIQPTNAFDIYGISGKGNLFNPNAPPGAAPGKATLNFVDGDTGIQLYNDDWNNFAPFVGLAYSPDFESGFFRGLFGEAGKSSIRAGYSISYLRDGFTVISNALGTGTTNPGLIQSAANTTPVGVLTAAGVALTTPAFTMPITDRQNFLVNPGNGLWAIDPALRIPYVQQWSVGFEREILSNTALEVRYVGNHAIKVWRAYDINEVNIFENGFLQEFLNAQRNLAARGGTSFAPSSAASPCAGCVDLPILNRFFTGLATASAFTSSTFIDNLNGNNVGGFASTLAFSNTYRTNRENPALGIPANFFVANPNAAFARLLTNDSMSNYHALQIELRRRFAQGLQFQADYTFSKTLTNAPDAQGSQTDLVSFRTLRDTSLDYRRSNIDQTHRFVANAIYELPFGKGRQFLGGANGFVNQIVGNWTIGGIITWATRPPYYIASGRSTFNSFNPTFAPAQLVGISFEEFKKNVGVYKHPAGVFYINPDLLVITTNPTTGKYVSSTLKPGLLGSPAPGTFGNFPMNSLNGPQYFNLDLSVTKRFPIGERVSLELKTTFINALNHPNFIVGAGNTQNFDSTSFGLISTTSGNERIIHFIGSVRF